MNSRSELQNLLGYTICVGWLPFNLRLNFCHRPNGLWLSGRRNPRPAQRFALRRSARAWFL